MINILRSGLKEMFLDIKNKKIKKQIANLLTFSRFLSPFVLLPLFYFNKTTIFIIMIILFFLTDMFDGYYARKYSSITIFGRYLDATVDKIFALTLLIPILNKKIYLILIFEIIIAIINLYAYFKKFKPKTIYIGKIKTFFLFVMIGFLYLNKFILVNNNYINIVKYLTIITQLLAIYSYLKEIYKKINS